MPVPGERYCAPALRECVETDRSIRGLEASARKRPYGIADPYYCQWGAVVGDRVRRLRRDRDMKLRDLAEALHKPEGGHYSPGFISKLERGRASAPLYVYLAVADALAVDAGVLLGPDSASLRTSDAEAMLLRCLRGLKIEPHDAITALVAAGAGIKPHPPNEPPHYRR
jgi:transcriptional regulator with XRE-family HTH domain